jgi:hypothetical protein
MAGLVPAIHVFSAAQKTWMPGTSPGMTASNDRVCLQHLYRFDFFAVFFFALFRFFEAFFGTFFPLALASESPIAIACLRLVTFLPERPLFRVPAFRFFITRSTSREAFLEYLRAIAFLRLLRLVKK